MTDCLVIEPGHGSLWLSDVRIEDGRVVGVAWDESDRGSGLLPDDYTGEPLTMNFPVSCVLRCATPAGEDR